MKEKYNVPTLEIFAEPVNGFLASSSDGLIDDNWGYSDVFKP